MAMFIVCNLLDRTYSGIA